MIKSKKPNKEIEPTKLDREVDSSHLIRAVVTNRDGKEVLERLGSRFKLANDIIDSIYTFDLSQANLSSTAYKILDFALVGLSEKLEPIRTENFYDHQGKPLDIDEKIINDIMADPSFINASFVKIPIKDIREQLQQKENSKIPTEFIDQAIDELTNLKLRWVSENERGVVSPISSVRVVYTDNLRVEKSVIREVLFGFDMLFCRYALAVNGYSRFNLMHHELSSTYAMIAYKYLAYRAEKRGAGIADDPNYIHTVTFTVDNWRKRLGIEPFLYHRIDKSEKLSKARDFSKACDSGVYLSDLLSVVAAYESDNLREKISELIIYSREIITNNPMVMPHELPIIFSTTISKGEQPSEFVNRFANVLSEIIDDKKAFQERLDDLTATVSCTLNSICNLDSCAPPKEDEKKTVKTKAQKLESLYKGKSIFLYKKTPYEDFKQLKKKVFMDCIRDKIQSFERGGIEFLSDKNGKDQSIIVNRAGGGSKATSIQINYKFNQQVFRTGLTVKELENNQKLEENELVSEAVQESEIIEQPIPVNTEPKPEEVEPKEVTEPTVDEKVAPTTEEPKPKRDSDLVADFNDNGLF
ncbi:hypothetical protein K6L10_07145 [Vibrio parahaemolyticus]|uniref:hypothetical protein n=1 Tax=Vibrio parahaemolyticus TaxID=670 RepID=UPI001C92E758|nr:hypothetical protein [Vibrio parahaemolyticus]MBY4651948.1 hypothetical protein [Vibrio parahaemolyticus]